MTQNQNNKVAHVGEHGLKKHDLKVSTVVFMIFCLVAAGCYGIEEMIPECGPGLTIVMLCVMPFVWALPFGLVASELGSVRPQEGGYYKWVQEALGEFWGFQAGWWRTISIYIDNASYVILAGGYAAAQWDLSWTGEFAIKAAMIIIFTWINIRGIKDVGVASTILSILVMVAFGIVAICGFLNWGGNAETADTISFQLTAYEPTVAADWLFFIAGGISVCMWMYSGYESMSTIAGEVSNPQVIPKGTLITIPLIMAVYIFPTVAGLGSLGQWENWGTEADTVGYATVVETFWGPAFGVFFVVVAILAQCSIFNTYIASGSRGFFSLADDYLAPPVLVKCDKKHGVPYIAVLTVAISTMILCMLPFGFVIILDVHMLIASYVLVYISAIVLRKKIPEEEYKFKIPGGFGFLVVLCIVPICVVLFAIFINGSDYYLGGMTAMASGPVLYFIWKRMYGGLAKKDPVAFPVNEKTGMAKGDTKRIALLFFIMTVMNVIMLLFTPWYEGWGTADSWESGDYFDGIIENVNVDSIVSFIGTYMDIFTVACALICVVMFIISKKVEKSK